MSQEIQLAPRIVRMKPSATLAVATKAAQLRAAGHDIINLSVGEPDFDTPLFIKEAAKTAIDAGYTKYTQVDGLPELKQAIIHKLQRDNHLTYAANEIVASSGAKQSIYNLLQVLLRPGDEVIIPAPFWVSYPEMVELADGRPVLLATTFEQQLKITPEQLAAAITPQTRLLIFNSPSNPTGLIYSAAELTALAEVLTAHPHVFILTDDIYEYIRWNQEPFVNLINVCPALQSRTILINGVSKAYAMTGWRIGYAAGPSILIKAMADLQSQCTSNPNTIAQKAAACALQAGPSCVNDMIKAFAHRHALVYQHFQEIAGVRVLAAEGAFYSFPDFSEVIARLPNVHNDVDLAEYLLEKAGLAFVPGTPFGAPGYLRLSFATSEAILLAAFERLKKCLRN